ncbi:MAG: aminopeptidase [Candidatus Dojkabacteria bacterium]
MDPRNTKLAQVLCKAVDVKKGDRVVIHSSDLEPIDLVRETLKAVLKAGAFPYVDIMGFNFALDRASYGDLAKTFYDNASEEQLSKPSEIYKHTAEWGNKHIRITSLDNYAHLDNVDPAKIALRSKGIHDYFRIIVDQKDWVLTYYPTQGMAQRSGMSYQELLDFYFNACLVDYKVMEKNGRALEKLMDKAKVVRIVGDHTDLTINVEGHLAKNACGQRNIPDGEVFMAPVWDKTEGHIYYDLPFYKSGAVINGAYLEFKNGKVVNATAEVGESALLAGLETDKGARYLGELGLGLNYKVKKVMGNTLFDEKIGGTVHVTLGASYIDERGGAPKNPNKSAIHWDMIKDMRKPGSYIEVDGKVVFKEGKWLSR